MSLADLSKRLDSIEMRLEKRLDRQAVKLAGELVALDLPLTVEKRLASLEAAVEAIEAILVDTKIARRVEERELC